MAKANGRSPPLNALRFFEAAARHLSFKKAAGELHVTPGAVSHQVKLLEDFLGVALFRRLTRALELTPEARAMLPKVREGAGDSSSRRWQRARAREARAPLTVIAPPNFAARWLVPRLARFTDAHPDARAARGEPSVDDRRARGRRGAGAGARRARRCAGRDGALRRRALSRARTSTSCFSAVYVPVCSPRLLAGAHPLRTPADLRYHTLLHDDTVVDGGRAAGLDRLARGAGHHRHRRLARPPLQRRFSRTRGRHRGHGRHARDPAAGAVRDRGRAPRGAVRHRGAGDLLVLPRHARGGASAIPRPTRFASGCSRRARPSAARPRARASPRGGSAGRAGRR